MLTIQKVIYVPTEPFLSSYLQTLSEQVSLRDLNKAINELPHRVVRLGPKEG